MKEWKINILKIIDTRISFYSRNKHLLLPKSKSSFRHLKRRVGSHVVFAWIHCTDVRIHCTDILIECR